MPSAGMTKLSNLVNPEVMADMGVYFTYVKDWKWSE